MNQMDPLSIAMPSMPIIIIIIIEISIHTNSIPHRLHTHPFSEN